MTQHMLEQNLSILYFNRTLFSEQLNIYHFYILIAVSADSLANFFRKARVLKNTDREILAVNDIK